MRTVLLILAIYFGGISACAQLKWQNVDSLYQPLPSSVHVYFTNDKWDTAAFRAFYVIAELKDKQLDFFADTTRDRRLTPSQFYEKNSKPLLVVNTTFFSFQTNRNLNAVIMDGRLVSYNIHTINNRGKDTFTYRHAFSGAIGIDKKRRPDIAWLFTDSSERYAYAAQSRVAVLNDSFSKLNPRRVKVMKHTFKLHPKEKDFVPIFNKWKMRTAVGGGPVLVQRGKLMISNNEEVRFAGKAIADKHPRTAMGYTADGKLIILVVEGRNKNAGGATLTQLAEIFVSLGCVEALNLDGGGSSCLLINGKHTIKLSDATGERPIPAVFIIREK